MTYWMNVKMAFGEVWEAFGQVGVALTALAYSLAGKP